MQTRAPIKVMIVDDSVVIRRILKNGLDASESVQVVSTAENGKIALENIKLFHPDVVLLDIEMPEMSGIETLTHIKANYPAIVVIMCSSLTEHGAKTTLDCLALGASDYIAKLSSAELSFSGKLDASKLFIDELLLKITSCSHYSDIEAPVKIKTTQRTHNNPDSIDVIAIGASTGGPEALMKLLKTFPPNFSTPILIVQHMPPMFTRLLAERLDTISNLRVCEAQHGQRVMDSTVYIAPGDRHMIIEKLGADCFVRLLDEPPINHIKPCVDRLFGSVATVYKQYCLAVVMTGMGMDGLAGCQQIKDAGGLIYIQDKASSVVWGMPGAIANKGLEDKQVGLSDMTAAIVSVVKEKSAVNITVDNK